MDQHELGRTGVAVSALGFGCGSVGGLLVRGDPDEQRRGVQAALEGGVSYFDTAAAYGDGLSEENLGRVLRDLGADPVVGTKVSLHKDEVGRAPTVLRTNLEAGLRRLGRERVDVCTLHGRVGPGLDLDADDVVGPIGEGMRDLVEAGLCRAVGFTGMGDSDAVTEVIASGHFGYFQCAYSLSNPSAGHTRGASGVVEDYGGVLDRARSLGMGVMGIRVLAGGVLSGDAEPHPNGSHNTRGPDTPRHRAAAAAIAPIAAGLGLSSPSEVAVAFALSNPDISTALVGFSSEAQVRNALAAAARAPLNASELERLESLVG